MIVVIIAGGSGTRLWPLSTPDFPKHLLSLTDESSLLQNTCRRVAELAPSEQIFVVSEASHAHHVAEQLPQIPQENILIEPARRGTASCFLLALDTIRKRGLDDQAIFFLWADNVIRDDAGFQGTANLAANLAESEEKMVFIGVEPTYASTGLGYMKKGGRLQKGFQLAEFVEKPDYKTAYRYFRSGNYLWNTGYLMATTSTLERELQANADGLWKQYQELQASQDTNTTYLGFEANTIEKALSEKLTDALVVSGAFDWLDVGSFKDLHDISELDGQGNYFRGENIYDAEVQNTYVRNEEDKPVVVIGIDNIAVVNTPHGVLVTRKDLSQKVGEISKKITP